MFESRPRYTSQDGESYPSVTTILGQFKYPRHLMEWANREGLAGRDITKSTLPAITTGKLAHAMIEAHVKGEDPDAVADELDEAGEDTSGGRRAFVAYLDWAKATQLKPIHSELQLVSDTYKFGGTLDHVALGPDGYEILDWKVTGRLYPESLVQVAAYAHLFSDGRPNKPGVEYEGMGCQVKRVRILRLGKETADFHDHSFSGSILRDAWEQFMDFRRCYNRLRRLERGVR